MLSAQDAMMVIEGLHWILQKSGMQIACHNLKYVHLGSLRGRRCVPDAQTSSPFSRLICPIKVFNQGSLGTLSTNPKALSSQRFKRQSTNTLNHSEIPVMIKRLLIL